MLDSAFSERKRLKTGIISADISAVDDICRLLTEKSTVQVRG